MQAHAVAIGPSAGLSSRLLSNRHMTDLRIQLNRKVYTNYDVVVGTCIVTNDQLRQFALLDVTLECVLSTMILKMEENPTTRKDVLAQYREKHRLLHVPVQLLPSPDHPQFGPLNQRFVLPRGEVQIPFRFQFPLNNSTEKISASKGGGNHLDGPLPPSFLRPKPVPSGDHPPEYSVQYHVKAHLNDGTLPRSGPSATQPFHFVPVQLLPHVVPGGRGEYSTILHASHVFEGKKPLYLAAGRKDDENGEGIHAVQITSKDKRVLPVDVQTRLEIRFGWCPGIVVDGRPLFRLVLVVQDPPSVFQLPNGGLLGLGTIKISDVDILLVAQYMVLADGEHRKEVFKYKVLKWQGEEVLDLCDTTPLLIHKGSYELALPHRVYCDYDVLSCPGLVVATRTCNLLVLHTFVANIRFKGGPNDRRKLFGIFDRNRFKIERAQFPVYQEMPGYTNEWFPEPPAETPGYTTEQLPEAASLGTGELLEAPELPPKS